MSKMKEEKKFKIEEYLKKHQFDFEWNDEEQFLKIHKLGTNWFVEYYELLYNNLLDINIDEFFKIKTEKQGSKVLLTTNGILYSING